MKQEKIGLVDLGERLPFAIGDLATKLNSLQPSFVFEEARPITAEAVGEPDVERRWYDLPRLWKLLRQNFAKEKYKYVIGITNCRITHTGEEEATAKERDYFSLGDFDFVAVVSVNKNVLRHKPDGKTSLQYAGFLVFLELILLVAKKDLNHLGNMECVFNDCTERDFLTDIILHGNICSTCEGKLAEANVHSSTINSARKVFFWAGTTGWRYTFRKTVLHPMAMLFLGNALGVTWASFADRSDVVLTAANEKHSLASASFGKEHYVVIAWLATSIAMAIVAISIRRRKKTSNA